MAERRVYLMVVPVPFRALGDGRAAIESAFAGHLRLLLDSLSQEVEELHVLAPEMSDERYRESRAGLAELSADHDRVRFVPAYAKDIGRVGYLLQLPRLLLRIWRAVGAARFVHAGSSPLWWPFENLSLLVGWLRRRRTVFVVDIDQRATPRMNLATGRWSRGEYLRTVLLHEPWAALQCHLARWCCSLLLLKGRALVRDYGRGRPHVHYILDSAHSASMVLDDDASRRRVAQLRESDRPLRACFFGRLVAYKGVEHMVAAVAAARAQGVDVTLDVYGDGDNRAVLETAIADRGLGEVVSLHGARPYGDAFFAELLQCDLLLAAPLMEDTPRSAVDAQALGMPVLAYDTYYYRELEQDGAGVTVVSWADPDALAAGLCRFAADRELLAGLAERGVAFARDNTQERWLERRAAWTLGDAQAP